MKKALLFDLDGTLFDTTDVNYLSYRDALAEEGLELTKAYYQEKCDGKSYKQFLPDLITGSKLETIHERKKALYPTYLNSARENVVLFDIIERLKDSYEIGLVTTASRANTMQILEHFGRTDLFDILVTQEDVEYTKPHPQAYNKALQLLNIEPENVTIFEDSFSGLEAALASGAHVVKIERF